MIYSDWYWLNDSSRTFLNRGYFEGDPKVRVKEIADYAEKILGIEDFSNKFFGYMAKGYYSLSSPVWSNFGKKKALSASCFGSIVEDSLDSILNAGREIGMMSKYGGGTSMYLGNIRPRGTEISMGGLADGPNHYATIYDTIIDKCKQGETRRGACAIYLDITHPDIKEFLKIGTEGNEIQNLQTGVCVSDDFMEQMIAGNSEYREIQAAVLQSRKETGFPYIFYTGNVNDNSPYNALGRRITHSNLCSEIALANNENESFVCVIGSINLLHWDEIKETDAVEVYTQFLNAVNMDFVAKAEHLPGMGRAYRFAKNHAAIGVGVLGYHSYLQRNLIPFESLTAKQKNHEIFKLISDRCGAESRRLCEELGLESIRPGYANVTQMAIAPTKSSSFILGQVSMGIEPIRSNYFIKDLAKIKEVYKNPFLKEELAKYNLDTEEVWASILAKDGSVDHLDFPTKEVFKSFIEISPKEVVLQAAQRQKFIDQSQSLNLSIHPSVSIKEINRLYISAWKEGVKTLYYQFSQSAAQSFSREINDCVTCEG